MDDYTWQKKIRERNFRYRRSLLSLILLIFFALGLGTGMWYFLIYTRTPEYALQQLQSAIEKKDSTAFSRYVNLDLLTTKAYDDLTLDLFSYDSSLTPQTKALFEKFYVLVKPQLAQGMSDTITARVKTGEWTLPEGTDILKGRQLGIDYERFLERSQLRNTSLIKTGEIKTSGHSAEAQLLVRDDYTQTEFTLLLVMEQNDDGHWQIAYIKNYREYLETIAPLHNKDIASYIDSTKSIIDTYNLQFAQHQARFKNLTKTASGRLSASQIKGLNTLLQAQVIPALQQRQQKLDTIDAPAGAAYLCSLRKKSTELTISSWQHFLKGISEDNEEELSTAESLHKQELEVDLRIDDIIKHTAVSKNIPNIP